MCDIYVGAAKYYLQYINTNVNSIHDVNTYNNASPINAENETNIIVINTNTIITIIIMLFIHRLHLNAHLMRLMCAIFR